MSGPEEAPDLDAAAQRAQALANSLSGPAPDLAPVYRSLDEALAQLNESGLRAEDMLPAEIEPGLGFSLREVRDGKTLWQAIGVAGRKSLCNPDSEVRKTVGSGPTTATSALVASIVAALGLPVVAIPIAITIAAVVTAVGVNGLCDWLSAPPDEPVAP